MRHRKSVLISTCLSLLVGLFPTVTLAEECVTCSPATSLQYTPAWGQAFVNQDGLGRYNLQYFYWNKAQRLAWLRNTPLSTFEMTLGSTIMMEWRMGWLHPHLGVPICPLLMWTPNSATRKLRKPLPLGQVMRKPCKRESLTVIKSI
jgi:hypothetical protein